MAKILGITICIAMLLFCVAPLQAYDNVIYIWQRNWDGYLEDAISAIQDTTGYFTVLCGDLKFKGESPVINLVDINWPYITQTETSTTIAFRINAGASRFFANNEIHSVAGSVENAIYRVLDSAPQDNIVGIQFDYDCPTSKLKDYGKFLEIMRERFKPLNERLAEFKISITALPTWLQNREFQKLIQGTDYYVLQLHSFELPKSAEQAAEIFPRDKARSYVEKASELKHPFYISLPTYGYEVAFNSEGNFLGLRSEGDPVFWGKGVKHIIKTVDPAEIRSFFKKGWASGHCLGVYWFRLPLRSDEFNWDIKTLVALIEGRDPSVNIRAELSSPEKGLYEIYLVNDGEQNIATSVGFELQWDTEALLVYDILHQYASERTKEGLEITGPAPKVGNKALVGWFRAVEKREKDVKLEVGDVQIPKAN